MSDSIVKRRLIQQAEQRGDFITDVDGYVYFWPTQGGSLGAFHLRVLADEMDRRNAEWDAKVSADNSEGSGS